MVTLQCYLSDDEYLKFQRVCRKESGCSPGVMMRQMVQRLISADDEKKVSVKE